MYGCESWTIKKAEHQWIDAFELWCWRRLLRVPWTARRSNQSILEEFSPGCSLEGLMLKLKLQYFGHLMGRNDSSEKTLMLLGKIEGRRRRGRQRMRWLDGIPNTMDMSVSKLRVLAIDREAWSVVIHGVTESRPTERLNWTELNWGTFLVSGPSLLRNIWGKAVCRLFWVSALILNSVWPWACCHLVLDVAPKNNGLEDLAQLYIFLISIVREKMVVTVSMVFCNHFKVCKM